MTLIRPLGRSSEVNALPLKSESDPTFCCTLSAADVHKCFELSADPRNEVIKFNYGISHLPHKPPSNMNLCLFCIDAVVQCSQCLHLHQLVLSPSAFDCAVPRMTNQNKEYLLFNSNSV